MPIAAVSCDMRILFLFRKSKLVLEHVRCKIPIQSLIRKVLSPWCWAPSETSTSTIFRLWYGVGVNQTGDLTHPGRMLYHDLRWQLYLKNISSEICSWRPSLSIVCILLTTYDRIFCRIYDRLLFIFLWSASCEEQHSILSDPLSVCFATLSWDDPNQLTSFPIHYVASWLN